MCYFLKDRIGCGRGWIKFSMNGKTGGDFQELSRL
jgi:hypothetical protein